MSDVKGQKPKSKKRVIMTSILAIAASLSACQDFDKYLKASHSPFPIQDHVCDFFNETQYMREYWIGISDKQGWPDVKVRIPSEYMDFRLESFKEAGRLDGAIGFGLRPLDFAPSQGYRGIQDYPNGPIDTARPGYKRPNGNILIRDPRPVAANVRRFSYGHRDETPFEEIIDTALPSKEAEGLSIPVNQKDFDKKKEVLINVQDGVITQYFYCSKWELEESGLYANVGCSVFGNYGPVSYNHSFDRDFLPEWKAQIHKVETFLDCMILDIEKEESP